MPPDHWVAYANYYRKKATTKYENVRKVAGALA